jgi:hypothetical protein
MELSKMKNSFNNMNELAKLLCHFEKGKKEINIAQMKEILKNLCALMVDQPETIATMIKHGLKKE